MVCVSANEKAVSLNLHRYSTGRHDAAARGVLSRSRGRRDPGGVALYSS
jgi:hypothetical protein